MKSLKVLHIIGSGTIGGAENLVFQLARHQHLYDEQISPAILFRQGHGYFYERARTDKIDVCSCRTKIGFGELRRLSRLMKNYDILHFHGLYPMLFLAAILSRKKTLYFIHGSRVMTKPISTFVPSTISNLKKWRPPTSKGLRRLLKRQWFKFFLNHCVRAIHAPSEFYVRLYIEKYGIKQNKISKLPLGMDFSLLRPTKSVEDMRQELGIASDESVIGCVSTFRPLKRIDRLINAFAIFLRSAPSTPAKLIIVGDGNERPVLEKMVLDLNIESRIVFVGLRQDVANFYNLFDMLVHPSQSECFSITLLEAAYFNLPIIVFSHSGGAEEIVREYMLGKIVEDDQDLACEIALQLKLLESRIPERILNKKISDTFSLKAFNDSLKTKYF